MEFTFQEAIRTGGTVAKVPRMAHPVRKRPCQSPRIPLGGRPICPDPTSESGLPTPVKSRDSSTSARRGSLPRTLVAVLSAIVVLLAACSASGPNGSIVIDAEPAPTPETGSFPTMGADEFEAVLAGLEGQPFIVNIWASWCGPCRTETPLLARASEEYAGRVTFIGVASKDNRQDSLDFIDEYGLTYLNVSDRQGEIRRWMGLRGFPTTFFFDAEGNLQASIVGGVSEQRLAALLEDLLR